MSRIISMLAALALLALPVLATAATYNIDPEHSNTGFKVRHLMVSNVKGSFGKVQGSVVIDDQDLTKSTVSVSIDTASIDTGVAKRDNHLRSPDFLDVAKYPTMTFVSTKVAKNGSGLKVSGNLTLHGVTRPVVLDVEGLSAESKDPWGNLRRGASATAKIDRKDFGLVWNKMLETGGVAVGDEVHIMIEVEMIKAK
ncbi:polyisoprenoid-binding protein [Geomonas silvestris]|uniref:Polyisoprenoid-binding protein n=1 Tax=Geomonas silvestris TaxID=2740184 RepID=A0A6V8MMJ6_9BACT|nr:YceI family protein [Geomonas silvestris]GFO61077.1 polyisoprenoid-binding protein [Geomonas silvestris]